MIHLTNGTHIESLMEFGLSEKEAQTYVALLKSGPSTAHTIAKLTGVNRATTYMIFEYLKEKGLVHTVPGPKKVTHFAAENPDALNRHAEERLRKMGDLQAKMKGVVNDLKNLQKLHTVKPIVTMYEGEKGITNAMEDSLTAQDKTIRVASSANNLFTLVPDYILTFAQRRIEKDIKMYGIHPFDSACIELTKHMPKFDESMPIPPSKYNFPADVAIYDNKVGYISAENGGISVIIENKDIAEIMKSLFDLAFEEAKRLNKELQKGKRTKKRRN